jgi:hypothetical protein
MYSANVEISTAACRCVVVLVCGEAQTTKPHHRASLRAYVHPKHAATRHSKKRRSHRHHSSLLPSLCFPADCVVVRRWSWCWCWCWWCWCWSWRCCCRCRCRRGGHDDATTTKRPTARRRPPPPPPLLPVTRPSRVRAGWPPRRRRRFRSPLHSHRVCCWCSQARPALRRW